jgi:hypothetical protein
VAAGARAGESTERMQDRRRVMVIRQEAFDVPVAHECEICVIGGSCTGVFAAVAAARLGAKTAVIENQGFFGGTATAGLVNVWHSLQEAAGGPGAERTADSTPRRQIIGGLTQEVIERLRRRSAVIEARDTPLANYRLNPAELALELDELVAEARVRPFLHARFVSAVAADGRMKAAIIEDKNGRRAVTASVFVDATGDGDVIARMGLPFSLLDGLQPPTACAIVLGLDEVERLNPGLKLGDALYDPRFPKALPRGFIWWAQVPGIPGARMVAGTRISHANCADADQLTRAEIEGRRQVRAMCDILRENFKGGGGVTLCAVPAHLGIRETRHAECLHRLTGDDLLSGKRFPDAIANGSYPVDVHHSDKPGITFRHLNGVEWHLVPGQPAVRGRWREPLREEPTFYQIPYRSMAPKGARNVLVAGRCIDADRSAYGAIRVMVNCNQTGQAAGVAAWLALHEGVEVARIDTGRLRAALSKQGAVVI